MPTQFDHEAWLRLFMYQAIAAFVFSRYADVIELRGIEQATIEAEFWEIVNAG